MTLVIDQGRKPVVMMYRIFLFSICLSLSSYSGYGHGGTDEHAHDESDTTADGLKKGGAGKRLGQSGFLLIMDRKTKKVISAPGGCKPTYVDGVLQPLYQTTKTFIHGHDLHVDSAGAIYFGEWNADRRYPAKLTPVD
jgi:hypothetical protein